MMLSILKSKIPFIGIGLALTFIALQAPIWMAERELRILEIQEKKDERQIHQAVEEMQRRIDALKFEEVINYYSIMPPIPVVPYGSDAAFVSDNEPMPVIEDIPDPVNIDWFETVLCDKDPHDNVTNYEYWEQAVSTGFSYDKPRARKTPEQLAASKGFPVTQRMPFGYAGEKQPLKYPNFDADCVLRSHMVIRIGDYSTKATVKISGPVMVRDI